MKYIKPSHFGFDSGFQPWLVLAAVGSDVTLVVGGKPRLQYFIILRWFFDHAKRVALIVVSNFEFYKKVCK